MIQPKYSPEEALQAIKLRMNYDSSKTLNENLNALTPPTTVIELNDYVFDFVVTENKK
jgi:multisubunit Na+/H+ antiporter MnhE subunit